MLEAKKEFDNRAEYDRRICRAIDYIHSHFREEMTIDTIAKSAAFSKFHFQRLFRATTGESVAEFVRRLRLETAARRLESLIRTWISQLLHWIWDSQAHKTSLRHLRTSLECLLLTIVQCHLLEFLFRNQENFRREADSIVDR